MNQSRIFAVPRSVGVPASNSGSRTATNLNAAFVNGTSGPAVAVRFMARTTDPIDKLYLFMDSHGGAIGSIAMEAKVYNENTAFRPGTTVRATSTAATIPGADDKWVEITFGTPYTPAVGEILWLVAYNTSGAPTTDYPGIMTSTTCNTQGSGTMVTDIGPLMCFTSANGFSSNGTSVIKMPFVIKCGSTYIGTPFTQANSTYYTSNTRTRGIVVTPTEDVSVNCGAVSPAVSNYNEVKIYDDSTAPGGTALATYDMDSNANATTGDVCGGVAFAAYTLLGGTTYKIVFTFGSSTAGPYVLQIEDYSSYSSVFDAMRAQDTINVPWGCIDDGAGGWTINKAICPSLALYIDDNPAQAGGGGLLVHPGMGGGARG